MLDRLFTHEDVCESIAQLPAGSGLIIPQVKAKRFKYKGNRMYYRLLPGNQLGEPCISASTVAKAVAPDEFLIKWIAEKGYAQAKQYMRDRGWFGTFMHMMIEKYLVALSIGNQDLCSVMFGEDLYQMFLDYGMDTGKAHLVEGEFERLAKSLFAFDQFCREYDVRPILVEHSLLDEETGVAATIDLYCELSISEKGYWGEVYKTGPRKGDPKLTSELVRRTGLINWKSGKHSGKKEAIQMHIEKMSFEANFSPKDFPVEFLWNWLPADFNPAAKDPSIYKIVKHENSRWANQVPHWIAIAKQEIGDVYSQPYKTHITGMFTPGSRAPENSPELHVITVGEFLKSENLEKYKLDEAALQGSGGIHDYDENSDKAGSPDGYSDNLFSNTLPNS